MGKARRGERGSGGGETTEEGRQRGRKGEAEGKGMRCWRREEVGKKKRGRCGPRGKGAGEKEEMGKN